MCAKKNKSVLHKLSGANAAELRRKLSELSQGLTSTPSSQTEPLSEQALNERLKKLINQAPVTLFMKGTPQEPRCGKY